MGVAFGGQVQRGVGGVQVGRPPMAIGEALDAHHAEERGQRTGVAGLDTAVDDIAEADHLDSHLSLGAQVEVVLEEPAQQLPPPPV